ncbi:MAG: hypothetical protein E7521_06125 [Ruminococcaceae bacterium]|nr:hypothetical protein [Oscillospiraceae bacterium]
MMGYIFLFIAVFTGVAKGYCGKKTSNYVNTITDGLILQYTRLTLCMFIGICLFLLSKNTFQMNIPILFISMLNGIANASFLIAWLFAVKSGAYLFVDICLTAGGILIPCICGALFFDGKITLLQYIGIVIMLLAILVMNSYNSSITKKKLSFGNILLLLCVAISNGTMGLCEKWFAYYTANNNIDCDLSSFSFATFFFAAAILRLSLTIICKKNKLNIVECYKSFPYKKLWVYIILIAFFLFFNTYLTTLTNTYINNTVLIYPLKFGSNLILSAIMASLIFKEKMNFKSVFGMLLITISILFINVL